MLCVFSILTSLLLHALLVAPVYNIAGSAPICTSLKESATPLCCSYLAYCFEYLHTVGCGLLPGVMTCTDWLATLESL